MYMYMYIYIYIYIYTGCHRRNGPNFRRVYMANPKHLNPKLNGYGDNGQRKVWTSCISA